MQALINHLLAYSQVGREECVLSIVEIGSVVSELTSNLAEQLKEAGAPLKFLRLYLPSRATSRISSRCSTIYGRIA
jgi:light-regulated signal transduction histidine kinase (bacteriophytochrome)